MSTFWYYFDNTVCAVAFVATVVWAAIEVMAAYNSDR